MEDAPLLALDPFSSPDLSNDIPKALLDALARQHCRQVRCPECGHQQWTTVLDDGERLESCRENGCAYQFWVQDEDVVAHGRPDGGQRVEEEHYE